MRITVTFKDELASLLMQYANKSNLSLASVVRLALSEFFERQRGTSVPIEPAKNMLGDVRKDRFDQLRWADTRCHACRLGSCSGHLYAEVYPKKEE